MQTFHDPISSINLQESLALRHTEQQKLKVMASTGSFYCREELAQANTTPSRKSHCQPLQFCCTAQGICNLMFQTFETQD